jgi:hypothetical protein
LLFKYTTWIQSWVNSGYDYLKYVNPGQRCRWVYKYWSTWGMKWGPDSFRISAPIYIYICLVKYLTGISFQTSYLVIIGIQWMVCWWILYAQVRNSNRVCSRNSSSAQFPPHAGPCSQQSSPPFTLHIISSYLGNGRETKRVNQLGFQGGTLVTWLRFIEIYSSMGHWWVLGYIHPSSPKWLLITPSLLPQSHYAKTKEQLIEL